jgi:diadenosine tetraphosphate (Ap4A) HIT family hydrolase
MFADESVLRTWHRLVKYRDPIVQSHVAGTRISRLNGPIGIIKALNIERLSRKRRTRFEGRTSEVYKTFDESEFNFIDLPEVEVLVRMPGYDVILNPSPIANGHSLLCPQMPLKHPQYLFQDCVTFACEISFDTARRADFRLLFNSLGAYASVNHLHFHMVWLRDSRFSGDSSITEDRIIPDKDLTLFPNGMLPIERTQITTERLIDGVTIGVTTDSPARLVRFESHGRQPPSDIRRFSVVLNSFIADLQENNIPHNVVWCPYGCVYVFPRQFQRNIDIAGDGADADGLHIAVIEAGGCVICFSQSAFDSITDEESVCDVFDRFVNLPHDKIVDILHRCYG